MAKVIIDNNCNSEEIKDGEFIRDVCEGLGVPFGCKQGICGTCMIEVLEGMNNLYEKNDREINMGLEDNQRLTCQCRIKNGLIKIRYLN